MFFIHIAAFIIVFGLISLKGLNEFYKMSEAAGASVNKIFGSILGAAVFLCICLMAAGYLPRTVWLVFFPLSSLSLIFELYRKKDTPLLNVSITIWGVLYVLVPLALISFLLFPPFSISYNPWFVLQILVLIWIYDSLAYVAGRFLGKHKLFERISPKKTNEGAIGGAVFTIAAAIYMASVDLFLDTIDWIFIAVTVLVAGTFGDLFESL